MAGLFGFGHRRRARARLRAACALVEREAEVRRALRERARADEARRRVVAENDRIWSGRP